MDSSNQEIIARINTATDPHRALGLARSATPEEVRRRFRLLSLRVHPDKNNNAAEATEAFQKLTAFHETLTTISQILHTSKQRHREHSRHDDDDSSDDDDDEFDEEEEMRSYQSGWRRGFTLDNGYSLDGIMEWDLPAWSWGSLRSRAENKPYLLG